MAGASPHSGQGQSNSHIVALLSLKVLLLAFFILLNALASFEEERRTAVVESVRQAFRGLVPASDNLSVNPSGAAVFDGGEDVADVLKQLFGADLPLVERPETSQARVLHIDLPVTDLFADNGDELQPEGAETLRLVAGVLTDPRFAAQQIHVDVLFGLAGPSSGLAGNRAALLRAALLVRALERDRVPAARLSAGLLPDFGGQVRLHFTIADPQPAAEERR
ncbi:MAG: hypothetical protein ACM35H_15885 [Bacteroidota bacterium]|nr:hypothetical protein [Kiloniellaceae bacterium]